MTKEQEEAIENFEKLSEYGLCYTINEKIQEDMKIVLDMLKEQEKQISDLKEENLHWRGQYHLLSRKINVIPVKKVEDKIERLKQEAISYGTFIDREVAVKIESEINVLQELLED